jgi:hypothetical protein
MDTWPIQPGELTPIDINFATTSTTPGLGPSENVSQIIECIGYDVDWNAITAQLINGDPTVDGQKVQIWVNGLVLGSTYFLSVLIQGSEGKKRKIRKYIKLRCKRL